MRLGKLLASCGYGTRSQTKKLVRLGIVEVNGKAIKTDSINIDLKSDIVTVNGEKIIYKEFVYLLLNKPKGFVSATKDNLHQTVIDLVPEYQHFNLFPVGRLDIDTTGVLLLTNDGELTHNLLAPNKHVSKTYFVKLEKPFEQSYITCISKGIDLGDFITKPGSVEKVSEFTCTLTITEGKFHQVKRMFENLGNKVIELDRIKFSNLEYGILEQGEFVELTKEEVYGAIK